MFTAFLIFAILVKAFCVWFVISVLAALLLCVQAFRMHGHLDQVEKLIPRGFGLTSVVVSLITGILWTVPL